MDCLWNLPRMDPQNTIESDLKTKFLGKIKVNTVNSFLKFGKRGKVRNILHTLKYKNNQDLGFFLGRMYGKELSEKKVFSDIDGIVYIPLHRKKLLQRGYNQAKVLAEGLADGLQLKVWENVLIRTKNTRTQAKSGGRIKRFKNLENAFVLGIQAEDLKGKKLILVDDVLTTGATLENAGKVLWDAGLSELHFITIASA